VSFGVKLSAPSDRYVSVSGELRDGTAVLRKDYTGPDDDGSTEPERRISGWVEPGKTVGEFQVKILDDDVKEPAETFTVAVDEADGADVPLPVTLTATIADDD
jgi:hypothetical protein